MKGWVEAQKQGVFADKLSQPFSGFPKTQDALEHWALVGSLSGGQIMGASFPEDITFC